MYPQSMPTEWTQRAHSSTLAECAPRFMTRGGDKKIQTENREFG